LCDCEERRRSIGGKCADIEWLRQFFANDQDAHVFFDPFFFVIVSSSSLISTTSKTRVIAIPTCEIDALFEHVLLLA
jgi:hypothetical protein